jgi:hypothetical protein
MKRRILQDEKIHDQNFMDDKDDQSIDLDDMFSNRKPKSESSPVKDVTTFRNWKPGGGHRMSADLSIESF